MIIRLNEGAWSNITVSGFSHIPVAAGYVWDPQSQSLFAHVASTDRSHRIPMVFSNKLTLPPFARFGALPSLGAPPANQDQIESDRVISLFPWVEGLSKANEFYQRGQVEDARKAIENAHQDLSHAHLKVVIRFFGSALHLIETYDEGGRDLLRGLGNGSQVMLEAKAFTEIQSYLDPSDMSLLERQMRHLRAPTEEECDWVLMRLKIEWGSDFVSAATKAPPGGKFSRYFDLFEYEFREARELYRNYCATSVSLGSSSSEMRQSFIGLLEQAKLFESAEGQNLLTRVDSITSPEVRDIIEKGLERLPRYLVSPYVPRSEIQIDDSEKEKLLKQLRAIQFILPMTKIDDAEGDALLKIFRKTVKSIYSRPSVFFHEDEVVSRLVEASRIYREIDPCKIMHIGEYDDEATAQYVAWDNFANVTFPSSGALTLAGKEKQLTVEEYLQPFIDDSLAREDIAQAVFYWGLLQDYFDSELQRYYNRRQVDLEVKVRKYRDLFLQNGGESFSFWDF